MGKITNHAQTKSILVLGLAKNKFLCYNKGVWKVISENLKMNYYQNIIN